MPIPCDLFQKIETGKTIPNSFYETSITPKPKPDKDIPRKENLRLISLMNIGTEMLNKISTNQINNLHKNTL